MRQWLCYCLSCSQSTSVLIALIVIIRCVCDCFGTKFDLHSPSTYLKRWRRCTLLVRVVIVLFATQDLKSRPGSAHEVWVRGRMVRLEDFISYCGKGVFLRVQGRFGRFFHVFSSASSPHVFWYSTPRYRSDLCLRLFPFRQSRVSTPHLQIYVRSEGGFSNRARSKGERFAKPV